MALKHYVITTSGSQQNVYTASGAAVDAAISWLSVQPDGANANPCYFGSSGQTVSSSVNGFSMPAGATGVPPAPAVFDLQGLVKLSELGVLGTNNEKVRLLVVEAYPGHQIV